MVGKIRGERFKAQGKGKNGLWKKRERNLLIGISL